MFFLLSDIQVVPLKMCWKVWIKASRWHPSKTILPVLFHSDLCWHWRGVVSCRQMSSGLACTKANTHVPEEAMASHSSTLTWKIPWMEEPGGLQSMGSLNRTRLSNFTFTFHFHVLEKEMATHSGVLAWRIPGTGEPGGLPSMGSHRVGHDWSNLGAAAAGCF